MGHKKVDKIETAKLVIIADDFTGALDTGIQFAKGGASTVTLTNVERWTPAIFQTPCDVLVIDSETRHLEKGDAYRTIYEIVSKCMTAKIPYIYKKTDSALRGNIGAELKAALDASKSRVLPLIPSYPQMNRCTVDGVHYVNGVPIADSLLGKDPFDPVESSRVADLFLDEKIYVKDRVRCNDVVAEAAVPQLLIYDAQTAAELDAIAAELVERRKVRVMAGCAGFAASLSKLFHFGQNVRAPQKFPSPLLILCGSVSEISRKQLRYEEEKGTLHITLGRKQQETSGYLETEEGRRWMDALKERFRRERIVMIDTGTDNIAEAADEEPEEIAHRRSDISRMLGMIGSNLMDAESDAVIMVIGGDTLQGFLKQMHCSRIVPVEEIETGTVLSRIVDGKRKMWVISKSGGFGEPNLVTNVINKLGFERGGRG